MFDEILKQSLQESLPIIQESIAYLLPELILVGAFLGIILLDLFVKKHKEIVFTLYFWVALGLCTSFLLPQQTLQQTSFLGTLLHDEMAFWFRLFLVIAVFLTTLLYLRSSFYHRAPQLLSTFYTLLLGMLIGLHLMVLSQHLLLLFIAIEVVSISAYILATLTFSKASTEASIKYILFGATAAALMLYGISWLYGLTGTLYFSQPTFVATLQTLGSPLVMVAILLTTAGLLFKITAVPLHIWTPDVYQVAPTPIVAFFSVAPKIAGLAVLFRWATAWQPLAVSLGNATFTFQNLLGFVALMSILLGNVAALSQTNVKRLLAYSGIAQVGFLLIPVVALSEASLSILTFYLLIYLLMNFLAFEVVSMVERRRQSVTLEGYQGLGQQQVVLGIVVLVAMLSLTGLPPTAGFTAKLLIFSILWKSYTLSQSPLLLWLFILCILNAAIALFYYLKLPYWMFFKQALKPPLSRIPWYDKSLWLLLTLLLLLFFFKADWLLG